MLREINIINPKQETLVLDLDDPGRNNILVTGIDGLGPPKATVNYQSLATADGGIFTSSRVDPRSITFHLEMVNGDAEEARRLTYKYFPIKKDIRMEFVSDQKAVYTTGYVESHEDNIFSNRETVDISVLCVDPWFYAVGQSSSVFSGVTPMFEFPFSNESLTDPLIEFGTIARDTRAILEFDGDVDTGVYITIHAMDDAEDITVYNVDTQESMKIDTGRITRMTGQSFGEKDDIEICTVPGSKYIRLLRKGVYTNIISALDRKSQWLVLRNGTNMFGFNARTGENNLLVTFEYRSQYGGI